MWMTVLALQLGSSAAEIKLAIERALLSRYLVFLSDFLCANITLTIYWAAFMARVDYTSVSSSKFELDERWLGCRAHHVD
jgi:hypothetical protein